MSCYHLAFTRGNNSSYVTENSGISVKTRHHRGEWDGAKRSLVKRSGEELPEIISPGQVIRYNDHYEN